MSNVAFGATYGSLVLDQSPFALEFGSEFGAPQSVSAVIASLLTDGEIEMWQRDSNRTVSLTVLIEWSDMLSAAEAEAALINEASKQRNVLTVTPGDGWGPVNVFDTFRAQVTWLRDDELEQQGYRRFALTMQAAPSIRSADLELVSAVGSGEAPPTPDTVLIDACTSTTGWTGSPNAPTVIGGTSVAESVSAAGAGPATAAMTLTRSGLSAGLMGTPFLRIDTSVSGSGFQAQPITVRVNGVVQTAVAINGTEYYYLPSVTTVTTIEVSASQPYLRPGSAQLKVNDISRTNMFPFIGTGRQQFRSLAVTGTARTQGSLQIQHETSSLGDVLVQTMVDDGSGHQPACRQYRVDGGFVSADSSTASGSYSPLDAATAETYDVPARTLPEGSYSVLARVKGASTGTPLITVSARTRVGSTDAATSSTAEFVSLAAGAWQIVELGRLVLPPTAVPAGSQAVVRLTASSASRVDIDDLWLFHTTLGAYSLVSCGTGTPAVGGPFNRLWLDTATLDRPEPSIWVGTAADRSDARHAGGSEVRAQGTHVFTPGNVNLFTVTSNALNAAASLSFYPRWHSNAAA